MTFKALHIVFIVCWFAAIFYLPRLFVYHSQALAANDQSTLKYFCTMERRLYILGHIAMGLTITTAIVLLVINPAWFKSQGWLHAKLVLVATLIAYYIYCGKLMKKLATGINPKTEKYYRIINEIPSVLLIIICLLAVLKPF